MPEPVLDIKKWGDRQASTIVEPTIERPVIFTNEKPIAFQVTAQEVARQYHDHVSPQQYEQFLLERLRAAGCDAVSGVLKLKLVRGKLTKKKSALYDQSGRFTYCWLPDEHWAGIQEMGGLQ